MTDAIGETTVLVVDDSRAIRQILSRSLAEAGYRVLQAGDGQAGVETAREHRPDLILLDIDMPVLDGMGAMRLLHDDPELRETPVLFLTARTSADEVAAGLGLGAQDYLRKPCESAELLARVTNALNIAGQRSELRRQAQRLDDLSTTDPLTGLGNRRRFDIAVGELRAASAPGEPLAVAMIDIDHFKAINDRNGHLIGDTVLSLVARRLRADARDDDTLVRWGGEEFLVLRTGDDCASLAASVEHMRAAVAERPLAVGVDQLVSVTVSGGWAIGRVADLDGVVESADEALYRAKAEGRNRVVAAATAAGGG
jgi:diguanylate cyclase (GGDEF)-like protein